MFLFFFLLLEDFFIPSGVASTRTGKLLLFRFRFLSFSSFSLCFPTTAAKTSSNEEAKSEEEERGEQQRRKEAGGRKLTTSSCAVRGGPSAAATLLRCCAAADSACNFAFCSDRATVTLRRPAPRLNERGEGGRAFNHSFSRDVTSIFPISRLCVSSFLGCVTMAAASRWLPMMTRVDFLFLLHCASREGLTTPIEQFSSIHRILLRTSNSSQPATIALTVAA